MYKLLEGIVKTLIGIILIVCIIINASNHNVVYFFQSSALTFISVFFVVFGIMDIEYSVKGLKC